MNPMQLRLAKKNREVKPKSWDTLYGHRVTSLFRQKYDPDKSEAIVNNYLDDPTNPKYVAEMREMQDYRRECKANVKASMHITD